jgi:hypothetical protein
VPVPPEALRGLRAALATRHGKERVIGTALGRLGVITAVADVDTDAFGTFSRTVPRAGSQQEAAVAKARAALAVDPAAALGLASEGAYGPHPLVPWVGQGRELVVAVFRSGEVAIGRHVTMAVPFGHADVRTAAEAEGFALRHPGHAFVVSGLAAGDDRPLRPTVGLRAGPDLRDAAAAAIARDGAARVEIDLRAMTNPPRMEAVAQAADDLATRLATPCPTCGVAGFGVEGVEGACPCAWCGAPTTLPRWDVARCVAGHEARTERASAADPAHCPRCNP